VETGAELDEPRRPRPGRAAPRRQIILRSSVLVLSLVGAGLAGFLGFKTFSNTHDETQIASIKLARTLLEEGQKATPGDPKLDSVRAEVKRFDQLRVVCYFLLAGGLLGVAGGVLALLRRGKIASPLLLLPALAAAVVAPITAVLTSPLLLAGLLALLIRSAPRRPPGPVAQEAA
jgi:hypothetical protein